MGNRTSETSHRPRNLSPSRFETEFVSDVNNATVVRIVHAFCGPDMKDRNRCAKAVLADVLKSWPRSLKTRYLITTGGFLSFEWPQHLTIADPAKPNPTDLLFLMKAAKDACEDFLIPAVRRRLAKVITFACFGNPVKPREWFLVPLFVVNEVIERIKDGTITEYVYDAPSARLVKAAS
jgi:hypothetical protein